MATVVTSMEAVPVSNLTFLLPIPGWAVKTCHCTRHTEHYSTTDLPRERIRRVSYPKIPGTRPYPFTVDSPRPVLDPASTNRRSNKEARPACHRIRSLFTVSSSQGSKACMLTETPHKFITSHGHAKKTRILRVGALCSSYSRVVKRLSQTMMITTLTQGQMSSINLRG
jgi:hypothetical protein